MDKHATLDGAQLSFEENKKKQIKFVKHNRLFSRSSTDLGFSDKFRHKIKLNGDAKPYRRAYGNKNFEKGKAMKKIVDKKSII